MAPAPTMKMKKASRITTACNPCRSRKQKCSGERPTCEQCLEYNRMCAWPEQLKRGPAKGYIEALEHRLQETENLLLSVLPYLSQPQLATIVAKRSSISTVPENERSAQRPTSPLRKKGVEYWKSFPLSSLENIRRWQQDCLHHRRSVGSSVSCDTPLDSDSRRSHDSLIGSPDDAAFDDNSPTDARSHSQFLSPAPSREPPPPTSIFVNQVDNDQRGVINGSSSTTTSHHHHNHANPTEPHHHLHQQHHHHHQQQQHHHHHHHQQQQRILTPGTDINSNGFYPVDQHTLNQLNFLKQDYQGNPSPQELSSWDAAPPIKFQQQFLW